jgi:hypothetical protein
MKLNRFMRNYELVISLKSGDVRITPPFRIQFEAFKSINRSLNKATIKIYNLAKDKYNELRKDEGEKKYLKCSLSVGYDDLGVVFQGNINDSEIRREGTDIITTLICIDGGYDFLNSFTSKTITNKSELVDTVLKDMPNTNKGKVTKQKPILRPKVLVGNSVKILEKNLQDGEDYFIDGEKLYILKSNEVISDFAPLVNSETGLLTTPSIQDKKLVFDTLMNPLLRCGGLCKLETIYEPKLNGIYRIEAITYSGDIDGDDWSQSVQCKMIKDYKVV